MVGKMTLSSRPQSVDDLKIIMQNKLNLDYDFTLQYEDPDFNGQLSCLVDIEELPEKAVLKVCAEFQRITNINLKSRFYAEPGRLIALFRQRAAWTGRAAEAMRSVLRIYDLQEQLDLNTRCTVAFPGVPIDLREEITGFLKPGMWRKLKSQTLQTHLSLSSQSSARTQLIMSSSTQRGLLLC
ncbi:hypothetical protein J4Q44_G00290630 [Coregonus suidteri]|uniref:Uncharacterized protein n=1 Tax=Coregonus suidteri TaxID=861788 RepID=A0AAN8QDW1_9TELE